MEVTYLNFTLVNFKKLVLNFIAVIFQKILPGGNTSFDVVFLARVVGNVENTLFINTSNHGVFTYQVRPRLKLIYFIKYSYHL